MGEAKRRRAKDGPFAPGTAIGVTMRAIREKGFSLDEMTQAIAEGLVMEAMLRTEAKTGATWKTADDFRLAGEEFSSLLDDVRRRGLAALDLPTAGN